MISRPKDELKDFYNREGFEGSFSNWRNVITITEIWHVSKNEEHWRNEEMIEKCGL